MSDCGISPSTEALNTRGSLRAGSLRLWKRDMFYIHFQNKSFCVQDRKLSPSSFSSSEDWLSDCVLARLCLRNWQSRKQVLHVRFTDTYHGTWHVITADCFWVLQHFQPPAECLHLNTPQMPRVTIVSPKLSLSPQESLLILLTSSWASKLQQLSTILDFAFNRECSQNTHSGDSSLALNSYFQSPLPLTWPRHYFICKYLPLANTDSKIPYPLNPGP